MFRNMMVLMAMMVPVCEAVAQVADSIRRGQVDSTRIADSTANPTPEGRIRDQAGEQVLDQVVVWGTMKEVSKLESPVPVEVYTAAFFKSNQTPSIFDALQQVNGVRPRSDEHPSELQSLLRSAYNVVSAKI